MADNIDFRNGRHTFAAVGDRNAVWHRLGTYVNSAMTSEEAIKLAQLDYEVGISPLYHNVNNEFERVFTHNITYRKDTNEIFAVVGSRYTVFQNKEAFEFLDAIVGNKLAVFDTAGSLGKGEVAFITLKLPSSIRLKDLPDEQIEHYVLFTLSHDGSSTIRFMDTPIRVVCNNTLDAALSNAGINFKFSIKHTLNMKKRLNDIQTMFININKAGEKLGEYLNNLAKIHVTEQHIETILARTILSKDAYDLQKDGTIIIKKDVSTKIQNKIYTIKKNIYTGVGQDIIEPETLYGVYNGITTYLSNSARYKSEDDKFNTLHTKENISHKAMSIITEMLNKNQITV